MASDLIRWTNGAGDRDWDTAGNWINLTDSSTGQPAADEYALFDLNVLGPITGMTQTEDLQGMIVTAAFADQIGQSGNALNIDISNTTTIATPTLKFAGNATLYLEATVDRIEAVSTGGSGRIVLTEGSSPDIRINGGATVQILEGFDVTTIYNGGTLTVDQSDGSDDITTYYGFGNSSLITSRDIDAATQGGGRLRLIDSADIDTSWTIAGSNARGEMHSDGSIAQLYGIEGAFSAYESPKSKYTMTASTVMGSGFNWRPYLKAGTVTFTAATVVIPKDGLLA